MTFLHVGLCPRVRDGYWVKDVYVRLREYWPWWPSITTNLYQTSADLELLQRLVWQVFSDQTVLFACIVGLNCDFTCRVRSVSFSL